MGERGWQQSSPVMRWHNLRPQQRGEYGEAAVSSLRVDLFDEADGGIALLRATISRTVIPNFEAEL